MEFEDREAFERWLKGQSDVAIAAIVCRAVLRVWIASVNQAEWKQGDDAESAKVLFCLWTARAILTAGAMATTLRSVRMLGLDLRPAAVNSATLANSAANKAGIASRGSGSAKATDFVGRIARVASAAARTAAGISSTSKAYQTIRECGNIAGTVSAGRVGPSSRGEFGAHYQKLHSSSVHLDRLLEFSELFVTPLWHDVGWPPYLSPEEIGPTLLDTDPRFDFFKRWYDGMVRGDPMDWELQRRVALIPQEVWEAGAGAVAGAIAEIEAEWLVEMAPLAETVEINPDTGLFRAVPVPVQNLPLISTLVSRVQDALEDAVQGHNGLNDRSGVVRLLSRTCTRYGNDPQRVEMDFTDAAISLKRQMSDSFDLPESEDNLLLLNAVEEGVRGLRANHPDVAQNREILAGLKLQEASDEDKAVLEKAEPILRAISEGSMAEDFAADIPELLNTSVGPLPRGAPSLPGAVRTFNRVSKMKLLWQKAADWHDGDHFKTLTVGLTLNEVGQLLYQVVQIGMRLLGVL